LTSSSRSLDLNPDNIENISVLKGLAATTIYGEQGKNGVILITTKTGSFSKQPGFDISVKQSFFVNEIANLPHFQNTYGVGGDQFYQYAFYASWGPAFDNSERLKLLPQFMGFDDDGYAIFPSPYTIDTPAEIKNYYL